MTNEFFLVFGCIQNHYASTGQLATKNTFGGHCMLSAQTSYQYKIVSIIRRSCIEKRKNDEKSFDSQALWTFQGRGQQTLFASHFIPFSPSSLIFSLSNCGSISLHAVSINKTITHQFLCSSCDVLCCVLSQCFRCVILTINKVTSFWEKCYIKGNKSNALYSLGYFILFSLFDCWPKKSRWFLI